MAEMATDKHFIAILHFFEPVVSFQFVARPIPDTFWCLAARDARSDRLQHFPDVWLEILQLIAGLRPGGWRESAGCTQAQTGE